MIDSLTKEEFDLLLKQADIAVNIYPFLRRGQALYGVLYSINPELANFINGTEIDPFYDDNRIPDFLTFIR